jgi:hypothetical protein
VIAFDMADWEMLGCAAVFDMLPHCATARSKQVTNVLKGVSTHRSFVLQCVDD